MKNIINKITKFKSGRHGRAILWNLFGTLFSQGSTFLTGILLARLLEKEAYGEFSVIQNTLLTLVSIAQVSTGLVATKYIAEYRDTDKSKAGRILGMCFVMTLVTGVIASLLMLFSATWISENILNSSSLKSSLLIGSAFVLFSVMNAYQTGALAGFESYKNIALYGASHAAFHVVICYCGGLTGGLNGVLIAFVCSAAIRWFIFAKILKLEAGRNKIKLEYKGIILEKVIIIKFAIPAALAGLSSMPAIWLSNTLLARQADGYSEMGIYSAMLTLKTLFSIIPTIVNNSATAILNNKFGGKDLNIFKLAIAQNIVITIATSLPGAAILMMSGDILITKIYGASFADEKIPTLALIMSVHIVLESIGVAIYHLIQSHSKMWGSFLFIALPRDILIIMLSHLLIPKYGSIGLAVAMLTGVSFALIIKIIIINRLKLHTKINN